MALSAPAELTPHYVFDDGPNKTVYSYERMTFDFANGVLARTSGYPGARTTRNRITSSPEQKNGHVIAFEREEEGTAMRYVMSLQPGALSLAKRVRARPRA